MASRDWTDDEHKLVETESGINNPRAKMPDEKCCTAKSVLSWIFEFALRAALVGAILAANSDLMPLFHREMRPSDWPQANYPHLKHGTIPYIHVVATACLAPIGIFIFYALCSSLVNGRTLGSKLFSEFLRSGLALSLSLIMTELVTDLMKKWIGRHRPDYLSRCFTPPDRQSDTVAWPSLPSRFYDVNGTGYLSDPFVEDVAAIFNESERCFDADEARSGRKSFPSGHTSFAFAGATFSALLSFYFSRRVSGGVRLHDTKKLKIPGSSLSLALLLLCYVPAFYVAISRTQDYRHYGSDVIAGGLLGTFITGLCFFNYYDLRL